MKGIRDTACGRRRARYAFGVSLIELLVAITIGALLIFGATQVYVDSRNTYEVNEATARLQETARFALTVLEPDIRMSNYWGLVKGAGVIVDQAAQTEASAGQPTSCGTNFARDLLQNLQASNNAYPFPGGTCAAYGTGAAVAADTLTVRRAQTDSTVSTANTLQVCSTRIAGRLYSDGSACTAPPHAQVNNLIVHAYYVSRDSEHRAGLPALRRHTLIAGPAFRDDEIIPGVEDMQIQFGIDPTGIDGIATRYIDPSAAPGPIDGQIVSVRIWLLVRAENPEVGFRDGRTYEYADRSYTPADNFRRLLVSRTIQIRNALGT
jgi:type IV pilus assembly protein PilW